MHRIGDAAWLDGRGRERHWTYFLMVPGPLAAEGLGQMSPRHNSGGTLLFADGHVRWLRKSATWHSLTDNLWKR